MHCIFEEIWQASGYGENQEVYEILKTIEKSKGDFKRRLIENKLEILKKLIEIPNHNKKDKKVCEKIKKENLKDFLHKNDQEILFDLNEYSKEHPELDLCLVSWDDNFIKAVKILLEKLSFNKYIGRENFNNQSS